MSEMEMKDDVETEEFIDELSDEALDRGARSYGASWLFCRAGN